MISYKIESDVWLPAPLEKVWNFVLDPQNLVKLSPPKYGLSVSADGPIHEGQRITMRLRVGAAGFGLSLTWIAAIQEFSAEGPRRSFVDTQESGPFAHWRHQHIFEAGAEWLEGQRSGSKVKLPTPGTWVRDRLEYSMPAGALGELAHSLWVRRDLENLFAYRAARLKELFTPAES